MACVLLALVFIMPAGWSWLSLVVVAVSNYALVAAGTNSEGRPAYSQAEDPRIVAMFNTPISFYGKVVDEVGRAISGAKITFSVHDKFWQETETRFESSSDENGLFSLVNVRGAGVYVNVVKDNYYTLPRPKSFAFYGPLRGKSDPELPTPTDPAVYILKAKGKAEPLAQIRRRSFRISKDGTPFDIALTNVIGATPAYLRVEAFTWDANKNDKGRYDWRCRLTLRGGGLMPRPDAFEFIAPFEGYEESLELVMRADDANWRGGFQQEYFAKLPSGCYATLYFDLATRGSHSCVIGAFVNPSPGSRNLEYDPALEIKTSLQRVGD